MQTNRIFIIDPYRKKVFEKHINISQLSNEISSLLNSSLFSYIPIDNEIQLIYDDTLLTNPPTNLPYFLFGEWEIPGIGILVGSGDNNFFSAEIDLNKLRREVWFFE